MAPSLLIVTGQARSVHSGVGTYAGMLLDGLPRQRDAIDVTVATWSGEQAADRHPGLTWIDLGAAPRHDPTPGRFWSLGRAVRDRLRADGRRFDVVHCLDAREGHALARLRPRAAGRLVGTVHDDYAAQATGWPWQYVGQAADPWRRWLFYRWQRRVERATYARFDRLLVNSTATGDMVRAAYDLDPARLCPTTLTIAPVVAAGDTVVLDGSPSLLFAGGNFYRKGLDLCVRALAQLRPHLPDARLHVAGSCRSERHLRRLVRQLGLDAAVQFHGRVEPPRMAAMMAAAGMLVMPSRTEALGLVYLEAFRAGLPVVAADRGGVAELVQHRRSGLVVAAGSVAPIASAVRELAGDAALSSRVVAGGREVLAGRTGERLLRETLAAYGFADAALPALASPSSRRRLDLPVAQRV